MDLKKNIIMLFTLSFILLNITSCKVEQNKTASEEGPSPDGLNIKQYINTIDGWSTPEVIASSSTSGKRGGQMVSPHLLKLADGRTLLTYLRRDTSGYPTIRYRIISSDGKNITPPINENGYEISSTVAPYGIDPTAAQLSNGDVVIAYGDYTNYDTSDPYTSDDVVIKIIKSLDLSSNSWTSKGTIAGKSEGDSYSAFVPSIIADSNDDLFLAYASGLETRSEDGLYKGSAVLYFRKGTYNNGSWTWGDPKEIHSASIYPSLRYSSKPSLIKSKTGLLVAFFVRAFKNLYPYTSWYREYDDSIYLARSTDNGDNWDASLIYDKVIYDSEETKINTSEKWPFLMELETTGNLWCAFTTNEDTEQFGGDHSIKLLRSDDSGATWSKNSIYSNTGKSYTWPALVQTGDSVMAVWDNDGWENSESYDTIQKSITTFSPPPPPPPPSCDPHPCAVNSCIQCCGSNGQCGG